MSGDLLAALLADALGAAAGARLARLARGVSDAEAARRGRFYRDLYRKSGSETRWDLEDTDDEVREEEDLQRELEEFEAVWPTIGEES